MRNKLLICGFVFLSILWLTVPRHGEPVESTVGRASISHPASPLPVDEQIEYVREHKFLVTKVVAAVESSTEMVTTTIPPTTTIVPTTTTAPPPPPTTVARSSGGGDPNDPASWDRLAQCESGGNWHINTGNGYYGGIQFSLSSWQAVGGTGYPHEHSRETQIEMGKRLHASGGWRHWPGCSRKFGWI